MPTVWFTLKKSLHCKSDPCEVYEPKASRSRLGSLFLTRNNTCRSGCSRSITNLKDVIHGGGRKHIERPSSCSPRSIGSSELLHPITHEVVLSGSRCELRVTGLGGGDPHEGGSGEGDGGGGGGGFGSTYAGNLRPGTPGPGGRNNALFQRKTADFFADREASSPSRAVPGNGGTHSVPLPSRRPNVPPPPATQTCHRCAEQFRRWEALEAHHLSKHAVSELLEGDSSRKIVEIICKASWSRSESSCGRIERILKIHNMQKTIARFEEYRETVKTRASKLPKKHVRCLADGNELLRFYGTTICCSLGIDGTSNLCSSDKCNVCRILRHGFSTKKELKGGLGVFTTSTSSTALESVGVLEHNLSLRKALLVCRVIAGRIHKPMDNLQNLAGHSGFDSVAGKVGPHGNIEELYLLNIRALLPCFVVICKG